MKSKGRIIRRSDNKSLIFLGTYLAVGVAFLAFCKRFFTFGKGGYHSGTGDE